MMLHMRYPFDDTKARLMWRTQTKGEAVVAASCGTHRPLKTGGRFAAGQQLVFNHPWVNLCDTTGTQPA